MNHYPHASVVLSQPGQMGVRWNQSELPGHRIFVPLLAGWIEALFECDHIAQELQIGDCAGQDRAGCKLIQVVIAARVPQRQGARAVRLLVQDRRLLPKRAFSTGGDYLTLRLGEQLRKLYGRADPDLPEAPTKRTARFPARLRPDLSRGERRWVRDIDRVGIDGVVMVTDLAKIFSRFNPLKQTRPAP